MWPSTCWDITSLYLYLLVSIILDILQVKYINYRLAHVDVCLDLAEFSLIISASNIIIENKNPET